MLECCVQINLAAKITWIKSLTCSSILIHQQLRESKIQAAIHTYATTAGPRGKSTELFESSCMLCNTLETKWQAPERKAKKYGPATIREAHIAVPEVLGQLCFNTQ